MYTMYGIKNCDTVKKAMKELESKKVNFDFFDFKKEIPSKEKILEWKKSMGEWPVNTKGRTYKMIHDDFESATDAGKIKLIMDNLSALKRPILEAKGKVVCFGFDKNIYSEL